MAIWLLHRQQPGFRPAAPPRPPKGRHV